jgi:hypothetical protein
VTRRWPPALVLGAAGAGVAFGLIFTLSPMFVCFCLSLPLLFAWAGKGLAPRERRWAMGLLGVAVAARLLVLAAIVLLTDHNRQAFATLFGDEIFITHSSVWLRNAALNIPMEPMAVVALLEKYGSSGFIYAVALLQLWFGPSPYGLRLLNSALHLTACVAWYRVLRVAYGSAPAMGAFLALLFWPTLFIWSVSALKDSSIFFLNALLVTALFAAVHVNTWRRWALAAGSAIVLLPAIGTVRPGAMEIAAAGAAGGLAGYAAARMPRLAAACAILGLLGLGLGLRSARVQESLLPRLQEAASYHRGTVATLGYTYKLLDEDLYGPVDADLYGPDTPQPDLHTMTWEKAIRFVMRAALSFWINPAPWQTAWVATTQLAYIPQQVLWYLAAALAIVGGVVGLRANLPLTSLLLAYTLAGMVIIGVSNGNIGTLIRMRDMAVPFVLCLSGVGAAALVEQWADRYAVGRTP